MMKKVYLDYAATSPVDPAVFQAMKPYFLKFFGNASEPHSWGVEAKKAVEKARSQVAELLNAKAEEIIFTSCATEAINLAHKGLIEALKLSGFKARPHIITTLIEHKAVLEACHHLKQLKLAKITYLSVDKYGLVDLKDIKKAIRPETVLISIMLVNNEVGTIEPLEKIGLMLKTVNALRKKQKLQKIYFHTDATQAIQYLDCNVDKLGVDLLSLTGHKFYAPKGIGALFIRQNTLLTRQQDGGGQENNLRSGTENVPYIVALGKACQLVKENKRKEGKRIAGLKNRLITQVLKIPQVKLTGHPDKRVPHIASFVVLGVEGEAMLLYLNDQGVAVSSGSACTSGELKPSHVLLAMGIKPEIAHGSLRFSLGKDTSKDDIDYLIKIFPPIVKKLRQMAPKL